VSNHTITYLVGAGLAVLGVIVFASLVTVPAAASFRRPLQRIAAVVLSLYVLAALIGIGVVIGAIVVVEWPRIF
jgi:uncharacterized membrane protein